jgi:integrase/recombinase XerD
MKIEEIVNATKSFQDFIRFKYKSENTAINYGAAVSKFLSSFPEVSRPSDINADMIINYLLKYDNLSTRRNAHSAIKLFYKYKSKNGESSKFRFIPYPEKPDTIPEHVNINEFMKLLSVCENKKHRAIICLMFDTGLRVSEVINLKLSDIDNSNMLLNIRQSKGRKDRKVKFTKVLLSILTDYYNEYLPNEYLLNGQFKDKYSTRSCQQIVKQLTEKAGLTKNFHPHSFRHGYAMTLLENGSTLDEIGNQLGHASKTSTEIYARMNNKVIQKIQSPLEQIINNHENYTNFNLISNTNFLPNTNQKTAF